MKLNKLLLICLILAAIVGIGEARWRRKSSSSRSKGSFFGSFMKKVFKAKVPSVHKFGDTIAWAAQITETPIQPASPIKESVLQQEPTPILSPSDMSGGPDTARTTSRKDYPNNEIMRKITDEDPAVQQEEVIIKLLTDEDSQLKDHQSQSDLTYYNFSPS